MADFRAGYHAAASLVLVCLLLGGFAAAEETLEEVYVSFLKRKLPDGSVDRQVRLADLPFRNIRGQKNAEITAEPLILARSGDSVTVKWAGVVTPQEDDWIGIYMSANATDTDYLDYYWARSSPTYLSGFGELTFSVVNMRTPYQFRYFQISGQGSYVLLASSNLVNFETSSEPTQGHIALTGYPDQMRVMFVSDSFKVPVVRYGTDPRSLTSSAVGSSRTYSADMICGQPGNIVSASLFINPGVMHDVLLQNLRPQTTYYYSYGHAGIPFSDVYSFRTSPVVGYGGPIQFAAFGDIGLTEAPGAHTTVDNLLRTADVTDFILLFGDVSYAMGRGYTWEQFMNFIEPISTRVPMMVSIGNHEYCYTDISDKDPSGATGNGFHPSWGNYGNDGGGECGVPMFYRYTMPDVSRGNSLFWYR